MRALLLAPIYNSLYARLVTKGILEENSLDLVGVVIRTHFNLHRFKSEWRRDGSRLLRKIFEKYYLGDKRFNDTLDTNLSGYAKSINLDFETLPGLCRKKSIPYISTCDLNSRKSLAFINKLAPDVIVFTGGGLIRRQLLEIPRLGVLNCHSGILPSYRGMDVVEWTAAEGNTRSIGFGVTQHRIDKGIDTGPILQKENIHIGKGDSFKSIRERIEVLMVQLMLDGLRKMRDGKMHPKAQSLDEGRQYFVMHPRIRQFAATRLHNDL